MSEIKRVIALGFFDGIHLGHAALLDKTTVIAKELGLVPAVISFDTHPDVLIRGESVPLINSAADRAWILESRFGIKDIIMLHFDEKFMHTPWQEFLQCLAEEHGAEYLVVGHDFCCGYKGKGTPERIKGFCSENGLGCEIIPKVTKDGVVISSSYIRQLLLEGETEKANEFLGHPHVLTGTVSGGKKIGRTMGTPTINMHFGEGVLIPRNGVYAAAASIGDARYKAVTNIGVRPTFGDSRQVSVESWLLDFDGDLYGKTVCLEFFGFIRPEMKFDSQIELQKQIFSDAESARQILKNI